MYKAANRRAEIIRTKGEYADTFNRACLNKRSPNSLDDARVPENMTNTFAPFMRSNVPVRMWQMSARIMP